MTVSSPPGPNVALVDSKRNPTVPWYDFFRSIPSTSNKSIYNVIDYGADPTGVKDSSPAFRAVVGSNRIIFVPPGTYTFSSDNTGGQTFPPNPAANVLVDIDSHNNWAIFGYGATINIASAAVTGGGTVFFISRCNNWQVYGLTINQAAPVTGFNGGFGIASCTNFHISHITFGPNLEHQAFYGNFMVDGLIDNIWMEHGQGGDFNRIKNCKFDNWRADGKNTTPSGLFFGVAPDPFTSSTVNQTGVTITQTDGVQITRMDVTGYGAGAWLREGRNYQFSGNHWHDMTTGSVAIHVSYQEPIQPFFPPDPTVYSSSGVPVHNVSVIGDSFRNIGPTAIGFYVNSLGIIATTAGTTDELSNITIDDCVFDNVDDVAIYCASTVGVTHLVYGRGNTFRDCNNNVSGAYPTLAGVLNATGSPTTNFTVVDGFVTVL